MNLGDHDYDHDYDHDSIRAIRACIAWLPIFTFPPKPFLAPEPVVVVGEGGYQGAQD